MESMNSSSMRIHIDLLKKNHQMCCVSKSPSVYNLKVYVRVRGISIFKINQDVRPTYGIHKV